MCLVSFLIDSSDYNSVSIADIAYLGDRSRETEKSFQVTILTDNDDSEPTEEFYLFVSSVQNVAVLTPQITVRILGSKCVSYTYIRINV